MIELTAYRRGKAFLTQAVDAVSAAEVFRRKAEGRNADWYAAERYPHEIAIGPWCGRDGVGVKIPRLLTLSEGGPRG